MEDLEQKIQPLEKTERPTEKTESIKTDSTSPTVIHTFDETQQERDLQSVDESSTVLHSPPQSSTLSYQGLKIGDRLSKLYDPEMEETAKAVLASLGRIDRPWLTEFEEGLLQFLEGNLRTDKGRK